MKRLLISFACFVAVCAGLAFQPPVPTNFVPKADVLLVRPGGVRIPYYPTANTDAARGVALQNACLAANIAGFNPGNANFATNLVGASANTATPTISSATYNFVAGDVGAWLYIQGGTAGQGWISGYYLILTTGTPANACTVQGRCSSIAAPTGGTWSVDYSQQTAVQFSYTDLAIQATNTQVKSAAHPFDVNCTGNTLIVTAGTNFTKQRVEIQSVNHGTNVATCYLPLGSAGVLGTASSTGGTCTMGGPCLADSIQLGAGGFAVSTVITGSATLDCLDLANGVNLVGMGSASTRIYTPSPGVQQVLQCFGVNEVIGVNIEDLGASAAEPILFAGTARATVRNCRFMSNAVNGPGAASCFWLYAGAVVTVFNSEIYGIYNDYATSFVYNSKLWSNGVQAYLRGGAGNCTFIDTSIEATGTNNENVVTLGLVGTYKFSNCPITLDSGTGQCIGLTGNNTKTIDINNCRIITASGGGGVVCTSTAGASTVVNINGGLLSGGTLGIKSTSCTFNVNGVGFSGNTTDVTRNSGTMNLVGGNPTTFSGAVTFGKTGHFAGATAAPTAASTQSDTITVAGTDAGGSIAFTAAQNGADTITVTFALPYATGPYVALTPANAATAALGQSFIASSNTTTFVFTTASLTQTTPYLWHYHVIQ